MCAEMKRQCGFWDAECLDCDRSIGAKESGDGRAEPAAAPPGPAETGPIDQKTTARIEGFQRILGSSILRGDSLAHRAREAGQQDPERSASGGCG